MESCDVLIVGGGPAGSSCAWKLHEAGVDVVVMDRALFPRDKVCAGWITPQVIDDLALDIDEYSRGRTFQPITGFRTGLIPEVEAVQTDYERPISFGIRRCEFDQYLLERAGARLRLGEPVTHIERGRHPARWIVNGVIETRWLVGAGGHFCPVARWLNPSTPKATTVVAQEAEFPVGFGASTVDCTRPELYFSADLSGYGWCLRKGRFLNVGFGQVSRGPLPGAVASFTSFLRARGRVACDTPLPWRGHAYRIMGDDTPRVVGPGVLLAGDAAGLASPLSGEGIRPAVESGLLAAEALCAAGSDDAAAELDAYSLNLHRRFGPSSARRWLSRAGLEGFLTPLLPRLIRVPWFVRHVLIDRVFLQTTVPALVARSG